MLVMPRILGENTTCLLYGSICQSVSLTSSRSSVTANRPNSVFPVVASRYFRHTIDSTLLAYTRPQCEQADSRSFGSSTPSTELPAKEFTSERRKANVNEFIFSPNSLLSLTTTRWVARWARRNRTFPLSSAFVDGCTVCTSSSSLTPRKRPSICRDHTSWKSSSVVTSFRLCTTIDRK